MHNEQIFFKTKASFLKSDKAIQKKRKGPCFVGPFTLLLVTLQMWGKLGKLPKSPGVSLSTDVVRHRLSHYLRAGQPVQRELCPGSVKLSVKTS